MPKYGTMRKVAEHKTRSGVGTPNTSDPVEYDINDNVACFVKGTRIATQSGLVAIEDLQIDDLVLTLDHGYQSVRWIGSRTVEASGKFAPIVFEPGSMGNKSQLSVSPQHRFLLQNSKQDVRPDDTEMLITAHLLINDKTIRRQEGGEVTYYHILFDAHELICSEGVWSESFHPNQRGLSSFDENTREEVLDLFPELREDLTSYGRPVRLIYPHQPKSNG